MEKIDWLIDHLLHIIRLNKEEPEHTEDLLINLIQDLADTYPHLRKK